MIIVRFVAEDVAFLVGSWALNRFWNSLLLEQVRTLSLQKALHFLHRSLWLALKFVSAKLGHLNVALGIAAKMRLVVLMCGVEVRDFEADG